MRPVVFALALTFVSGAAYADIAPPEPDASEGVWHGSMRQVDADGEKSYPMTLTLTEDGGTTDYPKLKCGGELQRLSSASGGYVVYKETITRGGFDRGKGEGCVDGVITLHSEADEIVLGWFGVFDGDPMLASARLTRGRSNAR